MACRWPTPHVIVIVIVHHECACLNASRACSAQAAPRCAPRLAARGRAGCPGARGGGDTCSRRFRRPVTLCGQAPHEHPSTRVSLKGPRPRVHRTALRCAGPGLLLAHSHRVGPHRSSGRPLAAAKQPVRRGTVRHARCVWRVHHPLKPGGQDPMLTLADLRPRLSVAGHRRAIWTAAFKRTRLDACRAPFGKWGPQPVRGHRRRTLWTWRLSCMRAWMPA